MIDLFAVAAMLLSFAISIILHESGHWIVARIYRYQPIFHFDRFGPAVEIPNLKRGVVPIVLAGLIAQVSTLFVALEFLTGTMVFTILMSLLSMGFSTSDLRLMVNRWRR